MISGSEFRNAQRTVLLEAAKMSYSYDFAEIPELTSDRVLAIGNVLWAATSEKVPSYMYTQRIFRSDCAFAQSDQNLHWVHILDFQELRADDEDTDLSTWMRSVV